MAANLHDSFSGHDQAEAIGAMRGFLDTAAESPEIQKYRREIRAHLALQPGESALDVGCGIGHHTCQLAIDQPECQVIGLDRQAVVDEAAQRGSQLGADVRWLAGEAEAIPLPDDSVDGCLIERVLKYLPEPERGVREIARVLKPGGRFAGFELDYDATMLGGREDIAGSIIDVLRASVSESRMGRRLPNLLRDAGMTGISFQPVTLTPPWQIQDAIVGNTVRQAISDGRLPDEPASAWLEEYAAAHEVGLFTVAFAGCLVTASMPA